MATPIGNLGDLSPRALAALRDADRRRLLSTRLGSAGQTLVTATGAEALPLAPAQLLAVTPGRVELIF